MLCLQSTTQWEFKDERVVKHPRGISVDNDGNVYVVVRDSINVVVISPDGQRHRQLLSSKDGLVKPRVLDYERSTSRLLVTDKSDIAFLYMILLFCTMFQEDNKILAQPRRSSSNDLCFNEINETYSNNRSGSY
jgi:hypothetical protein